MRGFLWWLGDSPHKGPVMQKFFHVLMSRWSHSSQTFDSGATLLKLLIPTFCPKKFLLCCVCGGLRMANATHIPQGYFTGTGAIICCNPEAFGSWEFTKIYNVTEYAYPSELLHWHPGNHMLQPWRIWVNIYKFTKIIKCHITVTP